MDSMILKKKESDRKFNSILMIIKNDFVRKRERERERLLVVAFCFASFKYLLNKLLYLETEKL
jgi:hypothetical protein